MVSTLRAGLRLALVALVTGAAAPPPSQAPSPAAFAALRQADLRVASVGYRLATANAAICLDHQPGLGLQLHSLGQYGVDARAAARAAFGFETGVAVEGVVPGSTAAAAGVRQGDSLVSINGAAVSAALPGATVPPSTAERDRVEAQLERLPQAAPLTLGVKRGVQEQTLVVTPVPACRSAFEVLLGAGNDSAADGAIIQIDAGLLDSLSDDELAVVLAHELSHNILRHRARLEAAGAHWGILAEIGKNGRLMGQAEIEADRLSVYLLANAHYDPFSAGRFWRGPGRKLDFGILRSRIYLSWKDRAALLDREAATIPTGAKLPYRPPLIDLATTPMSR
jgi:hypothetical protein